MQTDFLDVVKTIWICFVASAATVALFFPITAAALIGRKGNAAFLLCRLWGLIMLAATGVRVRLRGDGRIDLKQSYVIIANHQSFFDIPALVTRLPVPFRWVIKDEVRKAPLFGQALLASRNIFVDRSNREKAIASIDRGLHHLPSGVSLLFFAEGTRSMDGRLLPFKKGGFVAAVKGNLPVLPVAVKGTRKILPPGTVAYRSGKAEVVLGPPIFPLGAGNRDMARLMEETRSTIAANLSG